jgi:DNA-binding NarL/FixJ family response regulator
MKRLFIVGSEPFIAHAMRFALEYAPDANLYGMVHGPEWRDALRRADPDVVIVDGSDSDNPHAGRLPEIREVAPDASIVLLVGRLEEPALRVALDAHAVVCMPPSLRAGQIEAAADAPPRRALAAAIPRRPVQVVPHGRNGSNGNAVSHIDAKPPERCPLTARELEILGAVAEGNTNARIGRQLWVTEQTVKFHLSNIYRKLGVSNRTEASRYALMNGLTGDTPPRVGTGQLTPGRWSRSSTSALASTGLNTA